MKHRELRGVRETTRFVCGCIYEGSAGDESVLVQHCGLNGHVFEGHTTCEYCGIEEGDLSEIISFCPKHGPADDEPHLFAVATVNHDSYDLLGYLPYDLAIEYVKRLILCVKYDRIKVTPVRPTHNLREMRGAYEVCLNLDGSVASEGWVDYTAPDRLEPHWWVNASDEDHPELGSVRAVGWDRAEATARALAVLATPRKD